MIDNTIRALDATIDFVDVLIADAAPDDVASLYDQLTRLRAARRALEALEPAEREFVAFATDQA